MSPSMVEASPVNPWSTTTVGPVPATTTQPHTVGQIDGVDGSGHSRTAGTRS
ncbi:MAG: hypothetical protein R2695_02825 [Acidimicrobiales bacterium]